MKAFSKKTDEEAIIREVFEETSVNLVPESLRFFNAFKGAADGKANKQVSIGDRDNKTIIKNETLLNCFPFKLEIC